MFKPVIPWIGGKGRLIDWILPRFPSHTCYVEGFCGAAAIYFAKPPSEVEVINDFNGELVNMYRVMKHHPEEFVRQFKWALSSRKIYEWHQMTVPETLTDIQRAARFYYLQKLSFGGKVDGQCFGTATTSGPRLNLFRLEEDLSQAHLRLQNTIIEHLSWEKVVAKYDRPHTLFYLDPPYWDTEGYGVDFGFENYELMAELAMSIDGMMIISVNDIPEMRKVFGRLHTDSKPISYTVGGGAGSDAQELLAWNSNAEKAAKLFGSTLQLF
jgi:DNA adenine methylase